MSDYVMVLHNNAVDRAAIVASSEVATMPVTNLQDQQRSVVYRSSGAGSVTIDITMAADEDQIQAFGLVDHNLTLSGTVTLQAWSDAIDGASMVYSDTLQPYQPVYGYGDLLYGEGLYGGYDIYISGLSIADARAVLRPILMARISPASTARYWRITLLDAGLIYYQAGRVYLGPAWQPAMNYSWGSQRGREDRTPRRESRGGQYYGNPRANRSIVEFDLDWLSDTDRDRLWIMNMVLGENTPVILVQKPVGGYEQESSTLYGVFDQTNLRQVFSGNSAAPIRFTETL